MGPGPGHLAQPHLVLVPPVQVPLQDHTGSLPLPQLQEHGGCSREKAEASRRVPAAWSSAAPQVPQRLTPQRREHGEQHGALVVEEVGELGRAARGAEAAFPSLGGPPGTSSPRASSRSAPPTTTPPRRRKPWRRRRFLRAAGTWGCGRREGTCRRRGHHRSPCWGCRDRAVGGAFLWPLLWPLGDPAPPSVPPLHDPALPRPPPQSRPLSDSTQPPQSHPLT